MGNVVFWIVDNGQHSSQDGSVGAKKINKGYSKHKKQPADKASAKKNNIGGRYQFFVVVKIPGSEKIEYEKDQRNDTVVNAIPEEGVCCGSKKFEMTAKQDKRSDMPAHDKHSNGNTHKGETKNSDIS
jgi:hypothetical protein